MLRSGAMQQRQVKRIALNVVGGRNAGNADRHICQHSSPPPVSHPFTLQSGLADRLRELIVYDRAKLLQKVWRTRSFLPLTRSSTSRLRSLVCPFLNSARDNRGRRLPRRTTCCFIVIDQRSTVEQNSKNLRQMETSTLHSTSEISKLNYISFLSIHLVT